MSERLSREEIKLMLKGYENTEGCLQEEELCLQALDDMDARERAEKALRKIDVGNVSERTGAILAAYFEGSDE